MSNPATGGITKTEFEKAYELGVSNGMTIEHELLKNKVLDVLSRPIQNADLSWDECDSRYIDRIREEV